MHTFLISMVGTTKRARIHIILLYYRYAFIVNIAQSYTKIS